MKINTNNNQEKVNYWHNYKTNQTEVLSGLPPVDRLHEFLDQHKTVQALFNLHINTGKYPYKAFELTLIACLPNSERERIEAIAFDKRL